MLPYKQAKYYLKTAKMILGRGLVYISKFYIFTNLLFDNSHWGKNIYGQAWIARYTEWDRGSSLLLFQLQNSLNNDMWCLGFVILLPFLVCITWPLITLRHGFLRLVWSVLRRLGIGPPPRLTITGHHSAFHLVTSHPIRRADRCKRAKSQQTPFLDAHPRTHLAESNPTSRNSLSQNLERLNPENLRATRNPIKHACVINRYVLLRNDFDYFLRHHTTSKSRNVVELAALCSGYFSRRSDESVITSCIGYDTGDLVQNLGP
jgi:hypothetical protein